MILLRVFICAYMALKYIHYWSPARHSSDCFLDFICRVTHFYVFTAQNNIIIVLDHLLLESNKRRISVKYSNLSYFFFEEILWIFF